MLCEIAERTFREIRGGHDVNFLDTQFLEFPDLINYLLRRTDQARRPDRVRSHEAPLLLLQESRMAVMYLPESRVLRKAEALDPLYIIAPDIPEIGRNQRVVPAFLFPDFVKEMQLARDPRTGFIDDAFAGQPLARFEHRCRGE